MQHSGAGAAGSALAEAHVCRAQQTASLVMLAVRNAWFTLHQVLAAHMQKRMFAGQHAALVMHAVRIQQLLYTLKIAATHSIVALAGGIWCQLPPRSEQRLGV